MILDSESWAQEKLHYADYVVIGGGAAGVALALELSKSSAKIVLVEGGELEFSEISQDIYKGTCDLRQLPPGLAGSRLRFLGGSTNCWAGGCAELDELDFDQRDWVANSGWPINKSDLHGYYERAARFLSIDLKSVESPEGVNGILGLEGFDLRSLSYTNKVRFNSEFSGAIKKQKNLSVFINANLTHIKRESSGIVNSITIESYGGVKSLIKSRVFVLACGGIENARILLNSGLKSGVAIGNGNGLVGKYFCEHPIAPCATFVPANMTESKFDYDTDIFHSKLGAITIPFYKLPDKLQRQYKTLNGAIQFQSQELELTAAEISAWSAFQYYKGFSEVRPSIHDVLNIATNPLSVLDAYMSRKGISGGRIAMRFQIEQEPRAENCVTLSDKKDRFGQQRVNLHYDFGDIERRTIDVLTSYAAYSLQNLRLGTLRLDKQLYDDPVHLPIDLRGGQHHCGTTRMGSSSNVGVVDTNLRVFDCQNLYIVGSSVFPTNGWANPTFTIIALAIRLADHLRSTFDKP